MSTVTPFALRSRRTDALGWRRDGDGAGRAMTDDVRAVSVVNDAFYRAIESGDMDLLEAVLLDGAGAEAVTSVHPGWPMLRGRSEVLRSFAAVMAGTPYIQFILTDVEVRAVGDVAVLTCSENILTGVGGSEGEESGELGFAGGRVVATNVFRRTPSGWRMWVHHASPVMGEVDDEGGDEGGGG